MGAGNRMLQGRNGRNQFDISSSDLAELRQQVTGSTAANPRQPTPQEIQALEQQGYTVHMVVDCDPVLFGWLHRDSGASQSDVRGRQPYRRIRAQAWADCAAYVSCCVPSNPDPDWMDK